MPTFVEMSIQPPLLSARKINDEMISDPVLARLISEADRAACEVEDFIRSYLTLSVPGISTDDEILNWTLSDVISDLHAAVWNAASGHYKTAAGALRSALEMAVVALYFQHRENLHTGNGYNQAFQDWDQGKSGTPNWGTTKPHLISRSTFKKFLLDTGLNVPQLAHDYFNILCSFTHSRAFDPILKDYSNTMWMTGMAPARDDEIFRRIMDLLNRTISWIVTLWLVAFPGLLDASAGTTVGREAYPVRLFKGLEAERALIEAGWKPKP